jgi:hypothetical protein
MLGPIVGIGSIALFATFSSSYLVFTGSSNFATSGGFGPNQVSSALGLGALLAFLCLLNARGSVALKVLTFGLMVYLAVQSALTFSRGGLYNAAAGASMALFYIIRDARSRFQFVLVAALFFAVVHFILLPRLDAFTEGTLSERFQDVNTTGRDSLLEDDLQVWAENPILGVGPGMAKSYRELRGVAAHTEFSRLVSEHGVLGFAALVLFLAAGVQNLIRAPAPGSKAVVASMVGWSLLYMLNSAMRLVAPAFAFGLAFTTFLPEAQGAPAAAAQRGYRVLPARPAYRTTLRAKT